MPTTKYRKLPVGELLIDHAYQRPLDEKRVAKIAGDFRPEMLGVLEVSHRNGHYAVFDGQHRLRAIELVGFEQVGCLVHSGMTVAQEADLFNRLQRERKGIHAADAFRARRVAGEEHVEAIYRIVEAHGYKIATHPTAEIISSPKALERIYKRGNLPETLALLRSLWSGDEKSTYWTLIDALSTFEQGYGHRLDEPTLARLRETPAAVVIRRAASRSAARDWRGGGTIAHVDDVLAELRKATGLRGAPRTRRTNNAAAQ